MARPEKILNWSLASLALMFGAITLWVQLSNCPYKPVPQVREKFRPAFLAITSVDAAMLYLPSYYPSPHPTVRQQVEAVDAFVQDRFFHGASTYRPCDNWFANLVGYVRQDLSIPVLPDDILKYRRAICSQQAIVAEAMLKRLGIHYASVRFDRPGHFTPAARIDGIWYYFDPDTERQGLTPLAAIARGDTLRKMYPGPLGAQLTGAARAGRMRFGDVDTFPGPRGAAFDALTGFLSRYGWAVFAALFLLLNIDRARLPIWWWRREPAGKRVPGFDRHHQSGNLA